MFKYGISLMKRLLIVIKRLIINYIIWPATFILGSLRPVDKKLAVFAYNRNYSTLPGNLIEIKAEFEKRGYKCVEYGSPRDGLKRFINNIRFQFLYARSAVVFISDNFDQLYAHKPRKGSRVVQLWHACGAFKKWGYSTLDSQWGSERWVWKMFPKHTSYTDIFVSSESVIPYYSEAFNCPENIIRPLGVPRTDVFFNSEFINGAKDRLKKAIPEIGSRKIILYAPTFRGDNPTNAYNNRMIDYRKFKETLGEDYALVLKFHPFTYGKDNFSEKEKEEYGDFVFDCPKDIGIDTAICAADILISDYSSLVFEYSLFEKPMVFFAYDLEAYTESRDYYFDYKDFVPGPIVYNDDELLNVLRGPIDTSKVKAFRNKFMSGCNGNCTKQITDFIIDKLNEAQ